MLEVLVKPDGDDDHEYVLPLTALAPILAEPPLQMVELVPAFAKGNALTVIITEFDLLQPVAFTVSTNV